MSSTLQNAAELKWMSKEKPMILYRYCIFTYIGIIPWNKTGVVVEDMEKQVRGGFKSRKGRMRPANY